MCNKICKRCLYALLLAFFVVLLLPSLSKPTYAMGFNSFKWIKIASQTYQSIKDKKNDEEPSQLGQVGTNPTFEGGEDNEICTGGGLRTGNLKVSSNFSMQEDVYADFSRSLNQFLNIIEYATTLTLGVSILWSILSLAISFVKLGMAPSHPLARLRTMTEVGSCLVSVALLGSSKLISTLIIQMIFS